MEASIGKKKEASLTVLACTTKKKGVFTKWKYCTRKLLQKNETQACNSDGGNHNCFLKQHIRGKYTTRKVNYKEKKVTTSNKSRILQIRLESRVNAAVAIRPCKLLFCWWKKKAEEKKHM